MSKTKSVSTTGRKVTRVLPNLPSPCIQAGGIGGGNTSQYTVETSGKKSGLEVGYSYEKVADPNKPSPTVTSQGRGTTGFRVDFGKPQLATAHVNKPPYHIPSMPEINALPWNGFKVVSTFSGCGGSCLGYRMAGFKVVWANEFVPAAQDSYKANAAPDCYLDPRDIKLVQLADILRATGLQVGELDLLDGSPPCFPAGTLITTLHGLKPIESISLGSWVLTHTGRFRLVTAKMIRLYTGTMITLGFKYGRNSVTCTAEHPFYSRRRLPGAKKDYAVPSFVSAQDLRSGDLVFEPFSKGAVELVIPPIVLKQRGPTFGISGCDGFEMKLTMRDCSLDWLRLEIAWLLGFYAAEGHRRGKDPVLSSNKPTRRCVIYSVADSEVAMLCKRLRNVGLNCCVSKMRGGASRVTVTSLDFWTLCGVVGDGALHKCIPEAFHAAPVTWQKCFIDGYYCGDGCITRSSRVRSTMQKATTISKMLALGISRMSARVHGVIAQIKQTHWAGKGIIEGRNVTIHDTYSVGYTLPTSKRTRPGFTDNHGAWLPVISTQTHPAKVFVYNIEVARDNSYVAGGFAVHNCQAFSMAGKRAKGWGHEKKYEHGATQCNETLFSQYIRLLRGLRPKVFIAENVSGLVKGVAKGYFLEILRDLKANGYRVQCRVCDAQWLGVPQSRSRTIFIGVREDLNLDPVHPTPFPYRYSVRDALPHLSNLAYRRGQVTADSKWSPYNHEFDVNTEPCNTIPATADANFKVQVQCGARPATTKSANLPSPASDDGRTTNMQAVMVHPSGYNKARTHSLNNVSPAIMAGGMTGPGHSQTLLQEGVTCRKFTIAEVKRICAFPDDFVLTGSYSQQWARLGNSVPPLMMKAIAEVVRDKILLAIEEL